MDNKELNEIKNSLTILPVLRERATKLQLRITDEEKQLSQLLSKYEKERTDVEQLKEESFSSSLLKFIKKYEGKFDKETQEMIAAKLAYDKSNTHVKELHLELDDVKNRISVLEKQQQTYQVELNNREQIVLNWMDNDISKEYKRLEAEREMLSRQLYEIEEALRAAERVKNTAQQAMEHLDSAKGWATYDVWFDGGILSHMAKYDHIDSAEEEFNRLSSLLKDLKKELADIDILDMPSMNSIDSTTRTLDFWFDNIFTDMKVRNQINENLDLIEDLQNKVYSIIQTVKVRKESIIKNLEDIELRKNELIIGI